MSSTKKGVLNLKSDKCLFCGTETNKFISLDDNETSFCDNCFDVYSYWTGRIKNNSFVSDIREDMNYREDDKVVCIKQITEDNFNGSENHVHADPEDTGTIVHIDEFPTVYFHKSGTSTLVFPNEIRVVIK